MFILLILAISITILIPVFKKENYTLDRKIIQITKYLNERNTFIYDIDKCESCVDFTLEDAFDLMNKTEYRIFELTDEPFSYNCSKNYQFVLQLE